MGLGVRATATKASQMLKPSTVPLLSRPVRAINEPRKVGAGQVCAFGSACKDLDPDQLRREIVSPTAWLLDSDDYDTESAEYADEKRLAARSLGIDLRSHPAESEREDRRTQASPAPPYSEVEQIDSRNSDIDSAPKLEGDKTVAQDAQSWPLPPPRTVVVDDEGESYHLVEPKIEVSFRFSSVLVSR